MSDVDASAGVNGAPTNELASLSIGERAKEEVAKEGGVEGDAAATTAAEGEGETKPKYPLKVQYCPICTLPPEMADCLPKSQFEKCKKWLRVHTPHLFPDVFPEECAALANGTLTLPSEDLSDEGGGAGNGKKVAVPIEQKTSGGKKKKAPVEITLALGQRKGKKQVTIAYGLDLFGIKLKDATKAAKRKFATGSSITTSADSRDVIEIQGARQKDFAVLLHKEFGVPKDALYIINSKKKKEAAFPKE